MIKYNIAFFCHNVLFFKMISNALEIILKKEHYYKKWFSNENVKDYCVFSSVNGDRVADEDMFYFLFAVTSEKFDSTLSSNSLKIDRRSPKREELCSEEPSRQFDKAWTRHFSCEVTASKRENQTLLFSIQNIFSADWTTRLWSISILKYREDFERLVKKY